MVDDGLRYIKTLKNIYIYYIYAWFIMVIFPSTIKFDHPGHPSICIKGRPGKEPLQPPDDPQRQEQGKKENKHPGALLELPQVPKEDAKTMVLSNRHEGHIILINTFLFLVL